MGGTNETDNVHKNRDSKRERKRDVKEWVRMGVLEWVKEKSRKPRSHPSLRTHFHDDVCPLLLHHTHPCIQTDTTGYLLVMADCMHRSTLENLFNTMEQCNFRRAGRDVGGGLITCRVSHVASSHPRISQPLLSLPLSSVNQSSKRGSRALVWHLAASH